MKCQLFRQPENWCEYCEVNPPSNTPALRAESQIGGFLHDPEPSTVHEGHYETYLEMKKDGKIYTGRSSNG